jgi:phosphoenolpyruvate synthase/pyruvate phosphate dikinase
MPSYVRPDPPIHRGIPIPEDIEGEIISHLKKFNGSIAFAVRSSATAEDLPSISFLKNCVKPCVQKISITRLSLSEKKNTGHLKN